MESQDILNLQEAYLHVCENVSSGNSRRAQSSRAPIAQRVTDREAERIRQSARNNPRPSAVKHSDNSLEAMKRRWKEADEAKDAHERFQKSEREAKEQKRAPSRGIGKYESVLRRKGPTIARTPLSKAEEKLKNLNRLSREQPDRPELKLRAKKVRAAIKKSDQWGTPEAAKEEYVIGHLITEGYTDNYESAIAIYESMSDEWIYNILEDFVPLTPEKEERVKKRVGKLAREVQLHGARMKELKRKPLGKFRPGVKKEKEAIVKSARKKAKQVRSASDALIHASVSREANTQKKTNDLKQRLRDLGEEP